MYPKIADLGPLTLHSYGLFLALAFLTGIWWTSRLSRREGIHPDVIWNIGLIVIASALVGAKLLLVLVEFDYYREHPGEIFSLEMLRSGGVFLGGLIAALAATAFYFHRAKLPGWKLADLGAPGIALGHAIGRVGCFLAGCCHGKACTLPWAVTFTSQYANANVGVPLNVPLHPTQLYEALAELAIFGGLMAVRGRKKFDGQVMLLYLMVYSVVRFLLEFLRGGTTPSFISDALTSSQGIILIGLPTCVVLYWLRSRAPQSAAGEPRRGDKKRKR